MTLPEDYILVRKEVKHARIRVSEDGKVRIIVPHTFSEEDIQALFKKKTSWIEKNKTYFKNMSSIELQRNQLLLLGERYTYFYDTQFERKVIINREHKTILSKRDLLDPKIQEKWYRSIAKKHLVKRTTELAKKLDFSYNQIYIRDSNTKWGNCSKDKNISLNWKLIKTPPHVIDYIIIHELIHTIIMNHSSKFWTMLRAIYPNYKESVKWLDKYGNSL